jgi:type IX secretion system PorP/SprF family membrane protein
MKKTFIAFPIMAWLLWLSCVHAQQDPMYTHYMYNTQVINPAYAGSREALTVTGLLRAQWVAFDGSPLTQTVTLHTPLVTQNFGVGFAFSNDRIAQTYTTNGQIDFAFRFATGRHSQLALGLKGTASRFSENIAGLDLRDQVDPAFANYSPRRLLPNVGAGAYFKHDKYYVGISVPELLENQLRANTVSGSISGLKQRHYYAIGGAIFDLKNRLQFKPSAMVKYTYRAPIQIDVTGALIIRDKLILGLMYRYREATGLLLGFNITEQLMLGYSFDWSFANRTTRYNNGSHEFVLRYDFLFRSSQGARSSRYF